MTAGAWLLIFMLVVAAIIFMPLGVLWALNVLSSSAGWGWAIPYNFATWCAALVISAVFHHPSSKS